VLKDLKLFTSSIDNFRFIRQATDAIAESKPLETSTSSVVSGEGKGKHMERPPAPTACIPFIGKLVSFYGLKMVSDILCRCVLIAVTSTRQAPGPH
jgi:hypothetical protein